MVALPRLLHLIEVAPQLFAVAPGRAVDALQHRVLLVAAPVGPGHAEKAEGVGHDLAGVLDVGPAAEVLERVMLVGADDRLFGHLVAVFVDLSLVESVDEFQLVGLVGKELARLAGADLAIGEVVLAADDLAHALLYRLEVVGAESARRAFFVETEIEIVVETVLDRRPDGVLGVGIEFQHGLGHDVGCAMANLVKIVYL